MYTHPRISTARGVLLVGCPGLCGAQENLATYNSFFFSVEVDTDVSRALGTTLPGEVDSVAWSACLDVCLVYPTMTTTTTAATTATVTNTTATITTTTATTAAATTATSTSTSATTSSNTHY